jgi:thioredoxin-like negative regulator of GroEL
MLSLGDGSSSTDININMPLHHLQARKFYESAIRLEPGFLGAALALADLHVAEGRNREAVMLLEKYLRQWADDSLHIKLAQVFAATNMLSDALSHYQSALRCVTVYLNPAPGHMSRQDFVCEYV